MKKLIYLAATVMLLTACSSDLKVTVKDNLEVEYGDKLDNSILFDKEQSDEDITVKEVKILIQRKQENKKLLLYSVTLKRQKKKQLISQLRIRKSR